MKSVTSNLVSLVLASFLVHPAYSQGTCVPTWTEGPPVTGPCSARFKQITYTITFPDQFVTQHTGTGSGGCDTAWNCAPDNAPFTFYCDASFSPSAGSGFWVLTIQGTAPTCYQNLCVPTSAGETRYCACYNSGSPTTSVKSHACPPCPILVDVDGDGLDLSDNSSGVSFDISGFGLANRFSWTASGSDDAWLALDRNENGRIDDGTELFGNFTEQRDSSSPNGFAALAELDLSKHGGDSNGRIDDADAKFRDLRLWRDANHNGLSEPSELSTLQSAGITRIDLDYKVSRQTDKHGNRFQYRAKVYSERPAKVARWAWDVFLVSP